MADATKRTVTTVRHEYVLRSPTPVGELHKAVNWALADMPEDQRKWDDSCMVEARDEEVVVWWGRAAERGCVVSAPLQLSLAVGPTVTVHCFFCPHSLNGATPVEAHDEMERHYRSRHRSQVSRIVRWVR